MTRTKIFYDSEFTGLHQHTTLISIGLVSECGQQFYAEFSDYDKSQCDEWIMDNVIQHTRWIQHSETQVINHREDKTQLCFGDTAMVREQLQQWLVQFGQIEIWADCLAYDWVLFCQIFGGALFIPKQIFFMPFDLSTYFKLQGFEPNCNRADYAGVDSLTLHNALDDALLAKACYEKLKNLSGLKDLTGLD
jgi:hypothetical protein